MPVFDIGRNSVPIATCVSPSARPVGGAAVQGDAGQGLRSERHGNRAAGAHAEIADQRGVILQILELVGAQLRIPLLHEHVFLGIEIAEKGNLYDAKPVGAHVGDGIGDVDVHAVNHGHHCDQRRGG